MLSGGDETRKVSLNGSERHREVWNLTAGEMGYPIQWARDAGKPHAIDISAGDIEISEGDRTKFGLSKTGPIQNTPALWRALEDVTQTLETTRGRLLGASLSQRKEVVSAISTAHLTEGEKKLLDFVQNKIVPLVNQLRFLQADSRLEAWRLKIAKEGDLLSQKQWERRLDDKCHESVTDPRCSVFKDFPNKRPEYNENPIWTTIPSDITAEDEQAMKELWKGDPKRNPYFSPFTVVERDGKGSFKWTAMSVHPKTAGLIRSMSAAFAQGSSIPGIAPSLAKQLRAWSEALKSSEAYPFDEAERATIWQDEGNLEISIDVSPSYTSLGKSGISLIGGVVRPGEADFVRQNVRPVLQVMEDRLGQLLPGVYAARKLRGDIPVRFVDNVFRDANLQQTMNGEVLAYAFPSGTKVSDEEGVAKRVALMNHITLKFQHIYQPLAKVALDPDQLPLVTRRGVEMFTTLHEMSHGIGPQGGTTTAKGGTVTQDLGPLNDRIEEAKADTGGMSGVPFLGQKNVLDPQLQQEMYVSYVVGLIRQMRFGGRHHGGAAAMSFGYLFDKGAITVVEKNIAPAGEKPHLEKRFHVVTEQLPAALENLWLEVVKVQMSGDAKRGGDFMKENAEKVPALMDEMTAKFTTLGLPRDLWIHYFFF